MFFTLCWDDEFINSSWLAGQWAGQGSARSYSQPCPLPKNWGSDTQGHSWLFTWVLGSWTPLTDSPPRPAEYWQVTHPLVHCPGGDTQPVGSGLLRGDTVMFSDAAWWAQQLHHAQEILSAHPFLGVFLLTLVRPNRKICIRGTEQQCLSCGFFWWPQLVFFSCSLAKVWPITIICEAFRRQHGSHLVNPVTYCSFRHHLSWKLPET